MVLQALSLDVDSAFISTMLDFNTQYARAFSPPTNAHGSESAGLARSGEGGGSAVPGVDDSTKRELVEAAAIPQERRCVCLCVC